MNPPGLPQLTAALRQTPDTALSGRHHRAHSIRLTPDIDVRIGLSHARPSRIHLQGDLRPGHRQEARQDVAQPRRRSRAEVVHLTRLPLRHREEIGACDVTDIGKVTPRLKIP